MCDVFYYSRERCLLRLWYSISLFANLSSRITPRGASGVETQGLSGACPWFPWAIASINSVSFRTGDMASAKATAALALCAVVTRVLLAFFGWHDVLSSRVELTSPVDSIRRLKEGTALVALRMSPYHGSVVHAPPLVLFLLAPVLDYAEGMNNASVKAIVTIAPFLLADLFAAAALFSLAKRFDASLVVERKDLDTKETLVQTSNPALVQKTNPALCVSLYLANPMTIGAYFPLTTFRLPVCPYKTDIYFTIKASCVAGSSAGLGTACVVTACAAAAGGDPVIAGACCAGAAYLTGAPGVLLLYPIASLAAGNGIAKTTLEVSAGGSAVGGRESSGTPNKRFLATLVSFAVTCSILVPLSTAAFSEVGTTTTQWLTGTYIFTFRVADLTPNLGIYWYMFAELFPHFRGFFRWYVLISGGNVSSFPNPGTLLAHTRLTLFGTQPQRVSRVRGVSVRAAFRATREAQATALCYRNNGSHHHSWSVPNLGAGGWVPVFGPAGRRDVVTELAKLSRRRRFRRGCVYSAFPKSKHNLHRASLTVYCALLVTLTAYSRLLQIQHKRTAEARTRPTVCSYKSRKLRTRARD